jgi:glycosyltransferase involved in cell wall biosynthesis
MKLLLLSFYYPPDIGPGSIRAQSLVDALESNTQDDIQIDVLTTMPNRYLKFGADAAGHQRVGSTTIHRFGIPVHNNGILDQALAFGFYLIAVLRTARTKKWDVVIATSSRLLTASLGFWIAKRSGAKLYLDVRDLMTDTMESIFRANFLSIFIPLLRTIERRTYRAAYGINAVSAGFIPHITRIAPRVRVTQYTHGIDDDFLNAEFSLLPSNDLPLIVYAGNIGEGQGLHLILPDVASELEGKVRFRVIGDGGRRKLLETILKEKAISNVEIRDTVSRNSLISEYRSADLLLVHLNDYEAFHKVLPSKIFEYAATGKPILAGVAGYSAYFLRQGIKGVEVFNPCDAVGMRLSLLHLLKGPRIFERSEFLSAYRRKFIMSKMAKDILSINGDTK